ncbi:hypothetical protein ACFU99_31220 [Streptomyces sp. NPDC057654]|uniref:hypothetical protein n=1 Tax=Streptomyces sp. NPDC057654 TaxID=3346196 RepID=UPI0036ACC8C8
MTQQTRPIPMHTRRERFTPAAELARLRRESPLVKISEGESPGEPAEWLATGHAEVRRILGDPVRFSNRRRFGERDAGPRSEDWIGNLMDWRYPATKCPSACTRPYTGSIDCPSAGERRTGGKRLRGCR